MRARLAIKVAGAPVALREVVLRDKPAALIAVSPKASVPVLQLPDGHVLDQSLDIMRWALAQRDPHGWVRAAEAEDTQALIDLNDGAFKQALDRYKYAPRHPEHPAEVHRETAVALLVPLNERLARHRFLLRETPSLADMAIVPFVRQFALVDADWFATAALPHLRAWLNGIVATTLFEAMMPKFPVWRPGDPANVF